MKEKEFKVAIVSDGLTASGGAERVIEEILHIYPNAKIYTSVADKEVVQKHFPNVKVIKSFVHYIPFERYFRKELYLLYPIAYRLFSFLGYDVVISVSSAFGKFVKPWSRKTKHFVYCLTPPKFFWMKEGRAYKDTDRASYKFYSFFMDTILEKIWQYWDRKAIRSADYVIAISNVVKDRIKKFYDIDSPVIYSPVKVKDIVMNKNSESRENWFLYLGRIERYKGINVAVAACAEARVPLKVAGAGSQEEDMKSLVLELNAKGLVKFIGAPTDDEKYDLLRRCKALIFPVKDEDFGIVPIEANAAGAPVIALRSGGVVETISENSPKTGMFFNEWDALSLAEALKSFDPDDYDPYNCRHQAEQFSAELFRYKLNNYINDVLSSKKDT